MITFIGHSVEAVFARVVGGGDVTARGQWNYFSPDGT
jgi:hypothetical protein